MCESWCVSGFHSTNTCAINLLLQDMQACSHNTVPFRIGMLCRFGHFLVCLPALCGGRHGGTRICGLCRERGGHFCWTGCYRTRCRHCVGRGKANANFKAKDVLLQKRQNMQKKNQWYLAQLKSWNFATAKIQYGAITQSSFSDTDWFEISFTCLSYCSLSASDSR